MSEQKNEIRIGSVVTLGSYPQEADGTKAPIQWRVMDIQEGRALLLSRYVLDMRPFHTENEVIRWNYCALRDWLNQDFYSTAFSEQEREMIYQPKPHEDPMGDFLWEQLGMEDATIALNDPVFLLSSADVSQYFPPAEGKRMGCPGASARPAPYVAARYPDSVDRGNVIWWMRSSMTSWAMAFIVSPCDTTGISAVAEDNLNGVRPALWVKLPAPGLEETDSISHEDNVAPRADIQAEDGDLSDDLEVHEEILFTSEDVDKLANGKREEITSVVIPEGVTGIGNEAFSGCRSLTSVTIPDGVTSIEREAFYGCRSLTSISIPASVTSIGYRAFDGCRSLTSVTIPDGVTSIGNGAFRGCRSLTSITIPASVENIGKYAFYGCDHLIKVRIPMSVKRIGRYTFVGCPYAALSWYGADLESARSLLVLTLEQVARKKEQEEA